MATCEMMVHCPIHIPMIELYVCWLIPIHHKIRKVQEKKHHEDQGSSINEP